MSVAPLDGVRVVDLSQVVSGPVVTRLLAELGAEVIKIEPLEGELYRRTGRGADGSPTPNVNIARWSLGKRSVAIDLRREDGRAALWRVVENSDVLVENFRPGKLAQLGFGPEEVASRNPRMIYASVSGFGQTGDLAASPTYAIVAEAMGGLTRLANDANGRPVWLGFAMADVTAGALALSGVLAGLLRRTTTGKGARVDVSMVDSAIFMNDLDLLLTSLDRPHVAGHALQSPWGIYETADGYLVLAVMTQDHWKGVCEVSGSLDLFDDPRLQSGPSRAAYDGELIRPSVEAWTRSQSRDNAVARLRSAGVPAAPVADGADLLRDQRHRERGTIRTVQGLGREAVAVVGNPIKMDGLTPVPESRIPDLGEHTREVLRDVAAMSDDEVTRLANAKVVYMPETDDAAVS